MSSLRLLHTALYRRLLLGALVLLMVSGTAYATAPPENLGPVADAVVKDPTILFTWSEAVGTTTYTLKVKDTSRGVKFKVKLTPAQANCADGVCTFTPLAADWQPKNQTTYRWLVIARGTYDAGQSKLKSTKTAFTTKLPSPSVFGITAPFNGESVESGTAPTLTWEPSLNADSYKLVVIAPDRTKVINVKLDALSCAATCSYTPVAPLTLTGEYKLKLKAKNPYGKTKTRSFFVVFSNAPTGTTYYVDQNHPSAGDDNPGTLDLPWATLGKAAASAAAGDTVYIRSGSYAQQLHITQSGQPGAPVTFSAYPDELVTLDGNDVSDTPYWSGVVWLDNVAYVNVIGLRVINAPGAAILVYGSDHIRIAGNSTYDSVMSGIGVWESAFVIVEDNEVELANNDGEQENITISKTRDFVVRYNYVHDGGPGTHGGEGIDAKQGANNGRIYGNVIHSMNRLGIYVDAWDRRTYNIEVFGNTIYDIDAFGLVLVSEAGGLLENIFVHDNLIYETKYGLGIWGCCEDLADHHPMRNLTISNNTLYNNGFDTWGGGIYIDNPDIEDVVIRNNLLSKNHKFQILAEPRVPLSQLSVEHNLIDAFGGQDGEITGEDYVTGDPLFVDAQGLDFRLQSGSPAVDAGNCVGSAGVDFDGAQRPQDGNGDGVGRCDIGAFEFMSQASLIRLPLIPLPPTP